MLKHCSTEPIILAGTGDYTNFAQNTTEGADRDPDSNSDNCNIQDSLTHEDDCDEINVSKDIWLV
jgi:hypothetical protein